MASKVDVTWQAFQDADATHQEVAAATYRAMAESCDTAVYNINLKLIEATWQVEQTRKAYNEAVDESRTVVRNTDDQDR